MTIDTYGLGFDQYEDFFEKNIRLAARLYLKANTIIVNEGVTHADFKTLLDLYQEAIYGTNDECRRYQRCNNPEALKEATADIFGITPSREELMEEIQSVNAKVEALTDYVAKLVETTTDGLNGIAETLVD